jgi:hypothetical protein
MEPNQDPSYVTTAQEWMATGGEAAAMDPPREVQGPGQRYWERTVDERTAWYAIPAWVKPAAAAVEDLYWLAHRYHIGQHSTRAGGIGATLDWILKGRVAPITERREQPVAKNLAEAEMTAALATTDGADWAMFPLDLVYTQLGVAYHPPVVVDPAWSDGVWRGLRWLLGVADQAAPLHLPLRRPDGTIPTTEELYQQEMTQLSYSVRLPDERRELRLRVETDVCRYHRLVEDIEETRRGVLGV